MMMSLPNLKTDSLIGYSPLFVIGNRILDVGYGRGRVAQ